MEFGSHRVYLLVDPDNHYDILCSTIVDQRQILFRLNEYYGESLGDRLLSAFLEVHFGSQAAGQDYSTLAPGTLMFLSQLTSQGDILHQAFRIQSDFEPVLIHDDDARLYYITQGELDYVRGQVVQSADYLFRVLPGVLSSFLDPEVEDLVVTLPISDTSSIISAD